MMRRAHLLSAHSTHLPSQWQRNGSVSSITATRLPVLFTPVRQVQSVPEDLILLFSVSRLKLSSVPVSVPRSIRIRSLRWFCPLQLTRVLPFTPLPRLLSEPLRLWYLSGVTGTSQATRIRSQPHPLSVP